MRKRYIGLILVVCVCFCGCASEEDHENTERTNITTVKGTIVTHIYEPSAYHRSRRLTIKLSIPDGKVIMCEALRGEWLHRNDRGKKLMLQMAMLVKKADKVELVGWFGKSGVFNFKAISDGNETITMRESNLSLGETRD